MENRPAAKVLMGSSMRLACGCGIFWSRRSMLDLETRKLATAPPPTTALTAFRLEKIPFSGPERRERAESRFLAIKTSEKKTGAPFARMDSMSFSYCRESNVQRVCNAVSSARDVFPSTVETDGYTFAQV